MIFSKEPPGKSVPPMLPVNIVSPAISFFSAGKYKDKRLRSMVFHINYRDSYQFQDK
jgi:hypothetical protein